MDKIKVAVVGSRGRMGRQVCQAVTQAPDLELVAELDQGDDLALLPASGAQVVVDFTVPGVGQTNVLEYVAQGLHAVVGTTGWDETALTAVREALATQSTPSGVLIAPNFGLSAVLAMVFARQAAAFFESVEIIELHHPDKVDAPSGTAAHTAREVAKARADAAVAPPPDATETGHQARGMQVDGIAVHAVRLRGLVAHEEILLGNPGEMLTIRQDSFDRVSFMPGVLLAVRQIQDHPGLTVGLEHYLNLEG